MFRRLIITVSLILVACGAPAATQAPTQEPASPPTPENPSAPAVAESISWDKPYDNSIYDDPNASLICPENGTADGQPVFAQATSEQRNGLNVFVQHGLYVNKKNEVFRMDVVGVDTKIVEEYTTAVKVCFDHILLKSITKEFQEKIDTTPAPEPFGSNPADLSIEVYPQGYLDPTIPIEKIDELLKSTVSQPLGNWTGLLRENHLQTPAEAYKDKVQQDFAIYFIIDPSVANGGRHQYPERSSSKIYVTTSVSGGSGSVTAGLCRNSTIPFYRMTVTKGGVETASKSDVQGQNYSYDLGVKGNSPSGGRYRISGAWGYSGWSAGYWDAVPAGSASNCNP